MNNDILITSLASLMIDDIVLPNGKCHMNLLGGAGVHALAGMKIWSENVGYGGYIGNDFPPRMMQYLIKCGINVDHIQVVSNYPTVRAWNLFEDSSLDQRRFVMRTPYDIYKQYFRIKSENISELHENVKKAKGIHIFCSCERVINLCEEIRKQFPNCEHILWEPSASTFNQSKEDVIKSLKNVLSYVDSFSPNFNEIEYLFHDEENKSVDTPKEICIKLLQWGAKTIALRMGRNGSVVASSINECFHTIPSVPVTTVTDVTGAGNSYCGGFLTSMICDPGQLLVAGLRASVSASFTIESWGLSKDLLLSWDRLQLEAKNRLQILMSYDANDYVPNEMNSELTHNGNEASHNNNNTNYTQDSENINENLNNLNGDKLNDELLMKSKNISVDLEYCDDPLLQNAIDLKDTIPCNSNQAEPPPKESKSCVSIMLELQNNVSQLNIGRLKGKLKLFITILQERSYFHDLLKFISYTIHLHETCNSPYLVVNMYFDRHFGDIVMLLFQQILSSMNWTIWDTSHLYDTSISSKTSQSFVGKMSYKTCLSLVDILHEMKRLNFQFEFTSWPKVIKELLTFLECTCESISSITILSLNRKVTFNISGIKFTGVIPILKQYSSLNPSNNNLKTYNQNNILKTLLRRVVGLKPLIEFTSAQVFAALWILTQLVVSQQRSILYHPELNIGATPSSIGLTFDNCLMYCADQVHIRSWLIKAIPTKGSYTKVSDMELVSSTSRPTIILFHGNAGNVSNRLSLVKELHDCLNGLYNILMVEYRGYGINRDCTDNITEKGLILDGLAAIDYVRSRDDIGNDVILFGQSLGGAVCLAVARSYEIAQEMHKKQENSKQQNTTVYDDSDDEKDLRKPISIRGIIIENTFTSVHDMLGPLLSALFEPYITDKWDSLSRVKSIILPILFLSGTSDELVPPFMMNALHESCPSNDKEFVHIHGGKHNDTSSKEDYFKSIKSFLNRALVTN